MTDNSNNKNYQNNPAEGLRNVPQDKKPHETNENTYWEQTPSLTEIEEPELRPQRPSGLYPSQNSDPMQTGNNLYTDPPLKSPQDKKASLPFYNRDSSPPEGQAGQDSTAGPSTGRKPHRILITVLVTLALLILATVCVYANRAFLLNSLARLTMSPVEYYRFIEKNNTAAIIDLITENGDADTTVTTSGLAYDFTADVNINHDTVDSLLKSYYGSGLSDIESLIGIPFQKFTLKGLVGTEGSRINETLGLGLNGIQLITAELYMDSAEDKLLLKLPELSSSYLSLKDPAAKPADRSALEKLTPERTEDLMTRYSSLIIDQISQVTMDGDKELNLEHLSGNFTGLKIVMTAEDLYRIEMAVLDEAREDSYVTDLLSAYGITPDQYRDYLDNARTKLENSRNQLEDLTMMVYVDDWGRILGRSITSEDSVATVGYTVLLHKSDVEYNFYLTDDTGTTVVNVTGNQTGKGDLKDGKAVFTVTDPTDNTSTVSFDISYEDCYTKRIDNQTYQYGNITFSSLDLKGIQVLMELSTEENIQLCDMDVRMGAESLATVNVRTEYLKDYKVSLPPEDAQLYDLTQTQEYLSTFQVGDYLDDLSGKFGVDLKSLLGLFYSGSVN